MHWFWTDPHFSHKNIVLGESQWTDKSGCRPFNTVAEHDQAQLGTVNGFVDRRDILWLLGDFSFGGEANINKFRQQINCETIHIILGNHDHHIRKHAGSAFARYGLASVQDYAELEIDGTQIVLCHYPIESWVNMERGAYHLHGHVHGKARPIDGRYEPSYEGKGIMSLEYLKLLPKATEKRHDHIAGGNKFGTGE